ncbi:hypothetical protein Tcan_16996 [Toxocara canis]|uniref:Integrase_H2C2 domain-containing protein n=1 Tax=Toxocara canis TaxID=6265 RepID=A0A0B2V1D5_TOXCA|nr:hypothetical protein Tcan_16996 [Toxocara canis]
MKSLARGYVYWPFLDKSVGLVSQCSACALAAENPVKAELHSWPETTKHWQLSTLSEGYSLAKIFTKPSSVTTVNFSKDTFEKNSRNDNRYEWKQRLRRSIACTVEQQHLQRFVTQMFF